MTPELPAWVIPQVLDAGAFACCTNQDPFPFKCASCGRPVVLCCECDTLFPDLANLEVSGSFDRNTHRCHDCGAALGADFMQSPANRNSYAEWSRHGLGHLLTAITAQELLHMLGESTEQVAEWLRRGMLSTVTTRLPGLERLGDALTPIVPAAHVFRARGREVASSRTRGEALAWHATLSDPTERAYAMLGMTDAILPTGR
jgi:hypothetical protein